MATNVTLAPLLISSEVYADLFNIFIGGTILQFCAYIITGCGYTKGVDDPASGNFGYLISYCYVTALITILGYLISNITVFIIVFIVLYSLMYISRIYL